MSDSPESVVRKFLAAWENPEVNELLSFFADDAVYIAGPRGVHRGLDAIKSELESQLAMGFGGITSDVKSQVSNGGIVMMERVDSFNLGGKPFFMEVMAAIEIDRDGRIKRYRESFDLKSITDQIQAVGFSA
jgi:limonene-1,2-epoxide hydrolase